MWFEGQRWTGPDLSDACGRLVVSEDTFSLVRRLCNCSQLLPTPAGVIIHGPTTGTELRYNSSTLQFTRIAARRQNSRLPKGEDSSRPDVLSQSEALERWHPLGPAAGLSTVSHWTVDQLLSMLPQHDAKLPSSTHKNDVERCMVLTASNHASSPFVSSRPYDGFPLTRCAGGCPFYLGLSVPNLLAPTLVSGLGLCRLRLMGGAGQAAKDSSQWILISDINSICFPSISNWALNLRFMPALVIRLGPRQILALISTKFDGSCLSKYPLSARCTGKKSFAQDLLPFLSGGCCEVALLLSTATTTALSFKPPAPASAPALASPPPLLRCSSLVAPASSSSTSTPSTPSNSIKLHTPPRSSSSTIPILASYSPYPQCSPRRSYTRLKSPLPLSIRPYLTTTRKQRQKPTDASACGSHHDLVAKYAPQTKSLRPQTYAHAQKSANK
ncbi:hypothetical protein B0T10DRAFT_455777 [Thelonectria olida]|uniref:Uncharacterized protein n=1 Tax=Thelonectria olida TaxID=1576542 RepID=A0A9P8WEF7_9HYPO|nr:hypothetical protein B0T10DRAFT_455777 [Thelonectria olida]